MDTKNNWRNRTSLREKYSLMNLLGRAPMEVADPIAYMEYFPDNSTSDVNPEQES